jgi:6-phosphogluconolactonase
VLTLGTKERGEMKTDVRVFADVDEISLHLAEAAVRTINESVQTNGTCSVVLSGGSTPRTLYRMLSSQFRDQIPWTKVHVF